MAGFRFKRLADRRGERITHRNRAGQDILINPDSGKIEPWPSLGIVMLDVLPKASIGTKVVDEMISRGELVVEGEKVKTAPGGPPNNPNSKIHVFRHFDYMTFKTAEGDIRYKVTRSPDKVPAKDPTTGQMGTVIDWTYDLELVSDGTKKA